ncbi:hypothetical protein KBD45_01140 [Candidatus Dojkabacteria bacterium]|nr:hypothetical protein [Candidatus Dojkabacteria bacterium]
MYDLFANSKYGQKLANVVRYERYNPTNVTNKKWGEIFGDEVNNLKHMREIYNFSCKYLAKSTQLSKDEIDQLLLAAVSHDWGEAIIGDISYQFKNQDSEINEKIGFNQIIKEIIDDEKTQK